MNNSSELVLIIAAQTMVAPRQRADRFLADQANLPLSRSRIKVLIEDGHVQKNNKPFTDPSCLVSQGDIFKIVFPEPITATPQPEQINLPVLFEDDHLLVVDKPAGLVVHPAPGNETGTMVNALLGHCQNTLPGIGGERRPGIVHRLDKDTSGVMVVAKTEQALNDLSTQFSGRSISRTYQALCWGVLSSPGEVENLIGRDPKDRKKMAVVNRNGKYALTHYTPLANFGSAATLVQCRLKTGRTHQIRVHMAHIQHPLLGDPLYLRRIPAAAKTLPPSLKTLALDYPYQALHAAHLGFIHPFSKQYMEFTTPLPPTMQSLVDEFHKEYSQQY